MKCALYIRVSTTDQALHGYSLDAQEALLREYASAHSMEVAGVYSDEGVSANKSLEKRTALLRLLEDAKKGKFEVILFKDMTRLSRNASSYYKVQETIDKAKVGWIAVEQPYLETVTPTGRFQVSIMLGTAQLEAEQTGQRIKFVQESEIKRGHYPFPAHNCPTGYTTEKREDGNYLVIDPQRAEIIRTIYTVFKNTFNLQRCVEAVQDKHGIKYSETTINRIIRNPIYKGEFRGVPFCEPIIEESLWNTVQRSKRAYNGSKHKGEYIFSGVVKCALCGSTMRGLCPNDKYHMYQCRRNCHVTITQKELEQKLLDMIAPALDTYKVVVRNRRTDNAKLKRMRTKLQQKITRLNDLYTDGMIERNEYDRKRKEIDGQLDMLEPQQELPEITTNFTNMYDKLSPERKNVFWKAFLDYVTVNKNREVYISFHTTKVLAERMGMINSISHE